MSKSTLGNIYLLPSGDKPDSELIETLARGSSHIERIVSYGHTTPESYWYDQSTDEWVVLLQGEATIQYDDNETVNLTQGDYLFIPAHKRHKVTHTTEMPPCIWIAIHGKLSPINNPQVTF